MVSLLSFSSLRYFSSPFITVASEHLVAFNLSGASERFCLEALAGHPKHCRSTERPPKGGSTDADNRSSAWAHSATFLGKFGTLCSVHRAGLGLRWVPSAVWYLWAFTSPEPLFWRVCAGGHACANQKPCVHTARAAAVLQDIRKTRQVS